jgi:saccharopine dehydrogenase (NAD+, L-lysine-forming)
MLTAIPVIACLLQYLDGSLRKPGLWTQANIVEPNRLMTDMERLGVDVRIEGDIGAGE